MKHLTRVLIGASLIIGGGVGWLSPGNSASAGQFQWPGQPYLRDWYGNYSYRDLQYDWWGCSGSWCWFGAVGSYTNIIASGYRYDSHGANVSDGSPPDLWEGIQVSLTSANTPYTRWADMSGDMHGDVTVTSSYCQTQACAFITSFQGDGAVLHSTRVSGASSGTCTLKKYPAAWSC